MELLHGLLRSLVDVAIVLFEFIGVFVIISAGIKGIWGFIAAIR